ncbi:deoxyribose-phosphate aldolase [Pseudonocardia charpentierae]|jgi:deoxyribose-phosphate aldolase|uniref:Deoxyribose-phosphate aldolase n=1 Tax=Pseudonocardia charpentierae TaxID=3075545 RepID=A0ABU2NIZ1_9PSEU|nr:deoxyribose-phosphate aldolase [Pseudonocardia sp. DSM 45834]MDT0353940.1 deoxyribose-phosphate aldolase [Pseudonocardia sp. DSM 45834]
MSATRESVNISREQLLGMIDHSLLKPQLTRDEIVAGLEYAAEVRPKAICIVPNHLKLAAEILSGTDVLLGTVAGFPNGAMRTDVKVFESVKAVEDGATEVDMVIPIGALVGGEYDVVLADITEVVRAVAPAEVKVILETAYLTDEQILKGSALVSEAGAAFVKTSTGFAATGATPENVALLRKGAAPHTRVKAAGGMSTLADCIAVINAGADRIGISKTRAILAECGS